MDQQFSNGKNIIKCFGCLSLSLTYVLSLNRHYTYQLFDQ